MDNKFYIKKFIRDDGAKLEFDANEIYLAEENVLLARPNPETSAVNYTEADGGEMIRQKNPAFEQPINGLIVPKTTPYWTLVSRLTGFFQINHTYKIIYIEKDGAMFSASNAWLSAGLQIIPVPHEDYSEWTITLMLGDQYWRQYAENGAGQEVYANVVTLPLLTAAQGGEIWDAVGEKWDAVGGDWEAGEGGIQNVYVSSTANIYPVWVVEGPCINPTLQNNTTDTLAQYDGAIAAGQTLRVDFSTGAAYLDTALVTRNVSGLVSLRPGDNYVGFNSDGGATATSTIQWNGVI